MTTATDEPTTRDLAQRVHDELAEDYPALCDPHGEHPDPGDDPGFHVVMKAHDMAVAHGATCDGMDGEDAEFSDGPAMFRGGGAKPAGKPAAKASAKPGHAPSGHASGGCGTGAGGFKAGNTCGHGSNRNARVESARAAHTAAKNDVLKHVKAHRNATKAAAKAGEAAPHPKELHAAIKKAAKAHGELKAARDTHRAEQRDKRNVKARERRAVKAGRAEKLTARPSNRTHPAADRLERLAEHARANHVDPKELTEATSHADKHLDKAGAVDLAHRLGVGTDWRGKAHASKKGALAAVQDKIKKDSDARKSEAHEAATREHARRHAKPESPKPGSASHNDTVHSLMDHKDIKDLNNVRDHAAYHLQTYGGGDIKEAIGYAHEIGHSSADPAQREHYGKVAGYLEHARANSATPPKQAAREGQAKSPPTDKGSHADRLAVAAARHRQIGRSLRERANALRDRADSSGRGFVGHTKVSTGARNLPGVAGTGALHGLKEVTKAQADSAIPIARLKNRANDHGLRATRLELAAHEAGKAPEPVAPKGPSLRDQAAAHKADRRSGHSEKDIKARIKYLKSLPPNARRAAIVARQYDRLPQSHHDGFHPPSASLREGLTRLYDKKLPEGQRQAIDRSLSSPLWRAREAIAAHRAGLPAPR